jgi:hypothetical protein
MGALLRPDTTTGHYDALDGVCAGLSCALVTYNDTTFVQVGVGNHEIDTRENEFHSARGNDSGGECGVATLKRFPQFTSTSDMWCAIVGFADTCSC